MTALSAYADADAVPLERRFALPASLALHLLVLALLAFSLTLRPPPPPPMRPVLVELVSPRLLEPPQPSPLPAPASQRAGRRAGGFIHAAAILSEKALADPRSRQAREALPSLDVEERILQLCNLEAMEQTAAWNPAYHPSYVVAYARENIRIRDETIVADGAAFLSDGAWYELAYHCAVTPDFARIAGFDFRVGSSIPREDWEAYALPTGIDPGPAKGATAEN